MEATRPDTTDGTSDRRTFAAALAWIDAVPTVPRYGTCAVSTAGGRVLARPVVAPRDDPEHHRAAFAGYAISAGETLAASAYNPRIPSHATAVAAGWPLPPGTDAVLARDMADLGPDGDLEVTAPVAPGEGVEGAGTRARRGEDVLTVTGRPLRPEHLGWLADLGVTTVTVFEPPRVHLLAADDDASTLFPRPLIEREGAVVVVATTATPADLLVIAGSEDGAAALSAAGGRIDIASVALRPGGATALGWLAGVPVVALPAEPLARLTAFDLLAARLIRRLGGRAPTSASPVVTVATGRKLVSRIGSVDVIRVRLVDGRAEPVAACEVGGLATAARADGFVIIPAAREGYPPGHAIDVFLLP